MKIMQLKFLFYLISVPVGNFVVNAWNTCSGQKWCSGLKDRGPIDVYSVDPESVVIDDTSGTVSFTLNSNEDSGDLKVIVTSLANNTFRVQVTQPEYSRHELVNSLDGEPVVQFWDSAVNDGDSVTITTGDNVIDINFSPFKIDAIKADILEMTLEGNRLYFDPNTRAFSWSVSFPAAFQMYGIPEHIGRSPYQTTDTKNSYRMRNFNKYRHPVVKTIDSYSVIPVIYGHGINASAGVFFHNAAEQFWDIKSGEGESSVFVITERSFLDLFLLLGPKPVDLVRQFTTLVGKAYMPPLWTLGYFQSHSSYMDQDEVKDVMNKFDSHNFQMDAIWFDIKYTDCKEYYTRDLETFTNPVGLRDIIASTGRHIISIINNRVKVDPSYSVCDAVICRAFLSMSEDDNGSIPLRGGIWNDLDEPIVFNDNLEETIPDDATHFGGLLGLLERKHSFVWTKAHFTDTQTGDEWNYLYQTLPNIMKFNMVGMIFAGPDIGDFVENPDEKMLQRWYQTAAWLPFFRDTNHRAPYLYSDGVQDVIRNAIQMRYKHLPVWYTLFFEHTRNGDPIVRPLWYSYPEDSNVFSIDTQMLVGRDIMIRTVQRDGENPLKTYFPGGNEEMWLSEKDNKVFRGIGFVEIRVDITSLPVYYKRGSVIVRKETVRPNTAGMKEDRYTLFVSLTANNNAHGTVYLDDFEGFKYYNNKEYSYLSIDFTGTSFTISKIDPDSVGNAFPFIVEKIVFKNVIKDPEIGKPGEFETIAFTQDANGTPLKDLKLGLAKETTVKLL